MPKKFYITTPIYYVNARPHIGHAYTTIACDTIARRQRLLGSDTFFLTGTDEHGQKIQRAAEAAGKSPQQFTNEVSAEFRALWDRMRITYDDYIRTTSDRHKQGVQQLWRRIRDNGYIYKGSYTGQYCVFDEMYVEVGPGEPCPECGRPLKPSKKKIISSSFRRSRNRCCSFIPASRISFALKPVAMRSSPSFAPACAIYPSAARRFRGAFLFPMTRST